MFILSMGLTLKPMKLKHYLVQRLILLGIVFLSFWSSGQALDVSVLAFNVRVPVDPAPNDWNSRRPRVLAIINAQNPDFFGVQEAVPYVVTELDANLPAYAQIGRGRDANGGGEGSQIFYRTERWNVDWSDQGTFQLSPTPEVPGSNGWGFQWVRICTWARMINKTTGQAVYVYNTHFPLAPNERSLCATLVASRIANRKNKNEPVILTGDFNACEGEASMNYFLGQGGSPISMKDSYRVLYPTALAGTFHGFSGNAGACKIDYVYTMGESSVLEASIIRDNLLGGYPSDHFVVRGKMRYYATAADCNVRSPYSGTGISLPGKFEVENYDKGYNNVTYFDKTAGNTGNAYRTDAVDIEASTEGGFNIGWTEDGEWMEYSVTIPSGTYTVDARVASANTGNGTIHFELDGVVIGTPLTFTPSGGWQTWKTVSLPAFQVSGGTKKLRVVIDKGGFNLNAITFNQIIVREPFNGTPVSLPGKIEAEQYDKGLAGNAFMDLSAANNGGVYRTDAVDIEACAEGGFNVGWTEDTEWMEYAINLPTGKYTIDFRTASANATGGILHAEIDGINVTGAVTLPSTTGWQTWRTTTSKEFTITTAGKMLRLVVDKGGFNINSMTFIKIPEIVRNPYGGTAAVIPGVVQAENFDEGAASIVYNDVTTGNTGTAFRTTDVDLEVCAEGGHNVGWTAAGEWLEYTVNVTASDKYSIAVRVAGTSAGSISLNLDGAALTGPMATPNTGGWQTWRDVVKHNVSLTAGTHILRVNILQAGFNLNSITFTQGASLTYLRRDGKAIVNDNGNYILKTMNLGNWMVQEGYMFNMTGPNNMSHQFQFKNNLDALVGVARREQFYQEYLDRYYTKADIDSLAKWGFNSVRVPMHYNQFVSLSNPDVYYESGFVRIDQVISWCKANNMYAILDLHAAPGGQNSGDISDYNPAEPSLWESAANREKTVRLWKKFAERYANEPTVGAYDLINETNWPIPGNGLLLQLMKDLTTAIREVDNNHLLFIEGNGYANDFTNLTPPWDANMAYSFHKYWSYNDQGSLNFVTSIRDAHNIPIWLGEFGENSNQWVYEATRLFERNNIGWAIWPMKKMQSISGVTSFKEPQHWSKLVEYWKGNAPKPSAAEAESALSEMTENIRIENCSVNRGYLKALLDASGASTPFEKQTIPGRVTAAKYNEGLSGSAYSDVVSQNFHVSTGTYTTWNNGWFFRNDGVDIENSVSENGPVVGWMETGEFMEYTVTVATAGDYTVNARVAGYGGGKLTLLSGQTVKLNAVSIPSTNSWSTFQTVNIGTVNLSAGTHTLRILVAASGFNLNYLEFTPLALATSLAAPVAPSTPAITIYPNPMAGESVLNIATVARAGETTMTVSVTNSIGRVVAQKTIQALDGMFTTSLDMSLQTQGQYIVKVVSEVRSESTLLLR
jgi:endonuclease/exonuclease/phosphatase family metal-dependent hydrolase